MTPFDFQMRTRILFGAGRVAELGTLAAQLGAGRAFVVSDSGIVAAGHTARGIESLRAAGLETTLFTDVCENPTTGTVDRALAVAKDFRPDLIVGLGGGSSLDTAKGTNFLYAGGGRMQDYWGIGKAKGTLLPMIAVPTTAGTGSEMQSFALISDAQTHVKMACGDPQAACRVALLDPELTLTQPPRVTALTGIDAMAHALETYVTRKRNAVSLAYSREAWRLLEEHFPRVLETPTDIAARSGMQLGAAFAGVAIENSMLGAAHALANPLTARYDVPHGQAVALMLAHVIRFNGQQYGAWYEELLRHTSGVSGAPREEDGAAGLAEHVTRMIEKAGLFTRLSQCGVDESALPALAQDAAKQWTGSFNPRPIDVGSLESLYRDAY